MNIKTPDYKLDFLVITALSALAFALCANLGGLSWFKGTLGGILFTVPAIAYLFVRRPKPVKRIVIGSLLFGLVLGFFYELVMQASGGYDVTSVFLPRIFGHVPVDSMIAHMLMAGLIITFYEHFLVRGTTDKHSPRLKYGVILVASMVTIAAAVHLVRPSLLDIPYPYAIFGSLAVLSVVLMLAYRPAFRLKLLQLPPFFFLTFLLFMVVAIQFDWWHYPAGTQYIGWVSLAGGTKFPFEELFFWMLLYAPAIVTYYRFFVEPKDA
ncbi:MAG TPA: hypothetical protein VD735_01020 [Candidatus Saccharimonadales bacterium]|nr:hypothetical protein [Candidatus Saccharimonadales bacterium]